MICNWNNAWPLPNVEAHVNVKEQRSGLNFQGCHLELVLIVAIVNRTNEKTQETVT